MKISIILAVYNGAKTLQACLDSIAAQTYLNRELIVMDGGSTDGTVEVLQRNLDTISHWESSPDRGIYHAWNKALNHVSGDWIYFLGADDNFHDKHVLETFAMKIGDLGISPLVVYGKIAFCKGDKRRLIGEKWEKIRTKIKSGMYIPHQGMFHNKKLFEQCGRFDEKLQIAGDYLLLLKSLKFEEPYFLGNFVVADMYAGGKSSERATRWKVLKELRMAQREMGLKLTVGWVTAYLKAQCFRVFYRYA